MCPQIKAITDASIPVMAHLGLTPQSVNAFGGFKVQGKTVEAAQQLIEDAKAVEEAGAFCCCFRMCSGQTCPQGNRGVYIFLRLESEQERLRWTDSCLCRYALYVF